MADMPSLDLVVHPDVTPAIGLATDRALLARAADTGRGALRVFSFAGDVVALGRFHREPAGAPGVIVARRLTGGRAMAAGDGFVGMTLVLPHRSALDGDAPGALTAEQVMNRCVRGLLGALEPAGMPALYPGRDLVTVARRPIAGLGLEVDARGATLFEAVLSVGRDQSLLPQLLDRADPAGVVPVTMLLPGDVTSVQELTGRVPSVAEVAAWLRAGFSSRLGVRVDGDAIELVAGDAAAVAPPPVIAGERSARVATMLGVLEVDLSLAADGSIAAAAVCGDLLAPSWAIAQLQAALRGCAPALEPVSAVVEATFAMPGAFVLGIGPLRTLTETIVRAASS
ncbi:MAG TPA: hypothetical protein VGR62_15710 [Candidatus Binatia bacterium]|jgi:lipoate-protein ligase A|nr:hypothetical protein [Candidatus Binatia bacterium]